MGDGDRLRAAASVSEVAVVSCLGGVAWRAVAASVPSAALHRQLTTDNRGAAAPYISISRHRSFPLSKSAITRIDSGSLGLRTFVTAVANTVTLFVSPGAM